MDTIVGNSRLITLRYSTRMSDEYDQLYVIDDNRIRSSPIINWRYLPRLSDSCENVYISNVVHTTCFRNNLIYGYVR
jgi:hypothetical protein